MMSSTSTIRVLVVDDHAVVLQGLTTQINNEPDMTVAAIAADAEEAITKAGKCKPDIMLMDIELPGLDAFVAAQEVLERLPQVRVIFLSAFVYDKYIERALQVKAWGYISKSEPFHTVCDAIREVSRGWVYYSREIKARIVSTPNGPTLGPHPTTRRERLTVRELELLGYLARGMSTKDIARAMHISTKTVEGHKARISKRLDIHDRVELARYAFREGIATP